MKKYFFLLFDIPSAIILLMAIGRVITLFQDFFLNELFLELINSELIIQFHNPLSMILLSLIVLLIGIYMINAIKMYDYTEEKYMMTKRRKLLLFNGVNILFFFFIAGVYYFSLYQYLEPFEEDEKLLDCIIVIGLIFNFFVSLIRLLITSEKERKRLAKTYENHHK